MAFVGCWSIFWKMVGGGGYVLGSSGWWLIYFGSWWVVVGGNWYIFAGGRWWWIYFGWWWVMYFMSLFLGSPLFIITIKGLAAYLYFAIIAKVWLACCLRFCHFLSLWMFYINTTCSSAILKVIIFYQEHLEGIFNKYIVVSSQETYIQPNPLSPWNGNYNICITETWLEKKMHKEEGIISVFNNCHKFAQIRH